MLLINVQIQIFHIVIIIIISSVRTYLNSVGNKRLYVVLKCKNNCLHDR